MDQFTTEDLRTLVEHRDGWCVSIFLPTHRAGADAQQDPIRFKNLLRQAEARLIAAGVRPPNAKDLLAPPVRLLDDRHFWQHRGDGLAVFRAQTLERVYRLPVTVPEVVVVADQFHLKPLLPLLTEDDQFYVLAVSQNDVRLYLGRRDGLSEVDLQGVPRSLAEALKYDDPQKQLQFHTGAPSAGGRRAAIFHGHGVEDDAKDNIRRFFHLVDTGLRTHLRDRRIPLVLAGVEYLLPIYRQASTYPHLIEGGVIGNPEGQSPETLHASAWPLVQPHFTRKREEATAHYAALAGTGRTADTLESILPAAHQGRVETLFVAVGQQRWGVTDADGTVRHVHVHPQPGDEDLLNSAAIQTLLHGGTVYAVEPDEVPGTGDQAAAVVRY